MQNIFIGNTRINGNLEVEGTQTILNTETLIIQDGIIGVNTPAVVGRDSGLLIERAPDFTGTLTLINDTSAILEQIAEPGWQLKNNGETREILTVAGTTVTYASSPNFINGPYELFKFASAGFFYKPSTEKFYAGYTQNTNRDNILSITPGSLVVSRLEQLTGEQVYYVGKHGHDSLSGRTVSEARLTFASIPNGSTIICFDSGVYNETIYWAGATVYAPHATINYLQLDNSQIHVGSFVNVAMNGGILKFTSGGTIDASGINKIYGEKLTGLSGINCTGEINGHITEFDCLVSMQIYSGATVTLTGEISRSPTLAQGEGTLYFLCSKISSFTTVGFGTFYAIDAQMAASHFSNTNNPHSVTFAQISPMTQKGDLLTHNGTNANVLPRGTVGQILTVQGDLNLGWSTAGSTLKTFMIHPETTIVSSNSFITIAYFTWKQSEFSSFSTGRLIFNVTSTINVKFTDGSTNFLNSTFAAGYHSASLVSNPVADSVIFLQVQKNAPGGKITGVSLIF